jgi:threonine/homoserine/homoserine lactone efflux protein
MAYVVARSLGQGRRAGVISALAITAGSCVHISLATFGLAALLAQSPLAFRLLQYAGALYLLYIAWRLLQSQPGERTSPTPAASARRIFIQGVVTNVLNPKVALFILAFLPQFVDPGRGPAWAQMLLLGALFCISVAVVNGAIAVMAARVGRASAGSGIARWLRRASAGILALLALRLAFGARS